MVIYNKANPNGLALDEKSYLPKWQHTLGYSRIKLDPNEYFVLGDNRNRSSDSRIWGPVNQSLVTGRVFFRALPLKNLGGFPEVKY